MRAVLKYGWRVVIAAMLLTGASLLSQGMPYRLASFPPAAMSGRSLVCILFLTKLLMAVVLCYLTVRSRWSGTQLMCAIFVAHFGIYTFINQAQALVTMPSRIDPATVALLTANGFLVALPFSLVLVVLMGRARRPGLVMAFESPRLHFSAGQWLWRLAACAAGWVVLYVACYEVEDEAPLVLRLALQTVRALLLVVFVLPLVKMLKGGRLEAALAIGATLGALGGIAPAVSRSLLFQQELAWHGLARVGAGNCAYGVLSGYLFSRQPARDVQRGT
jgi:hypothetical protein